MSHATANLLSHAEVLALRGLRLRAAALKRLRQSGIYCEPAISIEYQHLAGRYVIRGVESGGAVQQIGAYAGYVGVGGETVSWLQEVDSVGRNGMHAVVVAPEVARVQMFRFQQTCDLLITEHRLMPVEGKNRPRLDNRILFHGVHGTLAMELWGNDQLSSSVAAPAFHDRSGEALLVPQHFQEAVRRLTLATSCLGCRHTHLLGASTPRSSLSGHCFPS